MPRVRRRASQPKRLSPSFWSQLFGREPRKTRSQRVFLGVESLESRWVMAGNPVVTLETNRGNIDIELFADTQPITVQNFLEYVNDFSYADPESETFSFFHRLVPGFVLQGGGFTTDSPTFEEI